MSLGTLYSCQGPKFQSRPRFRLDAAPEHRDRTFRVICYTYLSSPPVPGPAASTKPWGRRPRSTGSVAVPPSSLLTKRVRSSTLGDSQKATNEGGSDQIGTFIRDSKLEGFGYHLVAVFGSQSTGKSIPPRGMLLMLGTLLNRLFGTNFAVMDEINRKQTTKGTPAPRRGSVLGERW